MGFYLSDVAYTRDADETIVVNDVISTTFDLTPDTLESIGFWAYTWAPGKLISCVLRRRAGR